jgi:hypothetical protein
MLIDITKEELMQMLRSYFELEVESCPLNAEAFCDVLFRKYKVKSHKDNKGQDYV